jgi:hypothetical protein
LSGVSEVRVCLSGAYINSVHDRVSRVEPAAHNIFDGFDADSVLILKTEDTDLVETRLHAEVNPVLHCQYKLHLRATGCTQQNLARIIRRVRDALASQIKLNVSYVLVRIEHQISYITLHEVLETVLLAKIHKFLSKSALGDNGIPSCGFS